MIVKIKVVLAYSGGLDTSVILRWLTKHINEVATFTADLGQDEDFEAVKIKPQQVQLKYL